MPRLPGRLRHPGSLRRAPVDPFEQVAELRRGDRHHAVGWRRPNEAAALEPLRKQAHALPIVPQHLDEVTAAAAKHKQIAAVRVMAQRLLNEQRQPIKPFAHIGPTRRQPNPHAARNRDHRRSSTPTTRASAASFTSLPTITRAPPASTISIRPVFSADDAASRAALWSCPKVCEPDADRSASMTAGTNAPAPPSAIPCLAPAWRRQVNNKLALRS